MHSDDHDCASRDFWCCDFPPLSATRALLSDEGFCRRLTGRRSDRGNRGLQRDVWARGGNNWVSLPRAGTVGARLGHTFSHSTLSQLRSGPMLLLVVVVVGVEFWAVGMCGMVVSGAVESALTLYRRKPRSRHQPANQFDVRIPRCRSLPITPLYSVEFHSDHSERADKYSATHLTSAGMLTT